MMAETSLVSKCVSTQVTALVLWDRFLFVGEGNRLRVFDGKRQVSSTRAFEAHAVHNIQPSAGADSRAGSVSVCISGGRCLRMFQFEVAHHFSIRPTSKVVKLQDWIWDVRWLREKDRMAILLAHNYVVLWNSKSFEQMEVRRCQEDCILYSGALLEDVWIDLVILAGTVCSEVLLWNPESGSVWHRLTGHSGVIFSVRYDDATRRLCSASDDRSVCVWEHQFTTTASRWRSCTFVFLWKLFGHEARVWNALTAGRLLFSTGEDSLLCVWRCGTECSLANKFVAHNGASIWCAAIDSSQTFLATGCSSGGVKLWHIDRCFGGEDVGNVSRFSLDDLNDQVFHQDYPRTVTFLGSDSLLITTNEGLLCKYDHSSKRLTVIVRVEDFRSYTVLDVREDTVAIGDVRGQVTVLRTGQVDPHPIAGHNLPGEGLTGCETVAAWRQYESKVLNVKWLDDSVLLLNGSEGRLDVVQIVGTGHRVLLTLRLPPSKQRWFSAAALVGATLLCGTRNGSFHLYDASGQGTDEPLQSFHKLHGSHGLTSIDVDGEVVRTTGRDGFMRLFELRGQSLCELYKVWIPACSKWIAGVARGPEADRLVFGFHADNFVVWSETHGTTLWEVSCGGGHRACDFRLTTNGRATFAYLKDRRVLMAETSLADKTPVAVKVGQHSRRVCAVHFLLSHHGRPYLATGGEDTTVRIVTPQEHDDDFRVVHVLRSHISSVRAIASCPGVPGQVMVTGGGRAQMVLWMVTPCDGGDGIRVEHFLSHMLLGSEDQRRRRRKPWLGEDLVVGPETRYMDLAIWSVGSDDYVVAVACSDACLRLFSVDAQRRRLSLLLEDDRHDHAVLGVEHFRSVGGLSIVVSTATDGRVLVWDMTGVVASGGEERARVLHELTLHPSGVTALALRTRLEPTAGTTTTLLTLATGGDDAVLNVTRLRLREDDGTAEVAFVDRSSVTAAHSAQITGVHFLDDTLLVSVSGDLRVCLWRIEVGGNEPPRPIGPTFFSSVADVAAVAGTSAGAIVVAGMGLEWIELNK